MCVSVSLCVGHCSPSLSCAATCQHNKKERDIHNALANCVLQAWRYVTVSVLSYCSLRAKEVAYISEAPSPLPHMSTQNQMKHCIHFLVSHLHW